MKRMIAILFVLTVLSLCTAASAAEIRAASRSEIDIANRNDGYITVRMTTKTNKRIKIKTSFTTDDGTKIEYTYDLNGNCDPETFSLQSGDGKYVVSVMENVGGSRYTVIQTLGVNVTYTTQNAPFLIPIQNVNYTSESEAIKKAAELCADADTDLKKVEAIYKEIVENVVYDYDKARKVVNGNLGQYLPVIDVTLETKKGICFDYSSLFAAMLRSQGIPTKLSMGYVNDTAGAVYHAWNEVYITDIGWVKIRSNIYFSGTEFERMDSTFAAGNRNGTRTSFMSDDKNYIKDKEY